MSITDHWTQPGGAAVVATALLLASMTSAATLRAGPTPELADDGVRVRINPQPRAEISSETVHGWRFEDGLEGWEAAHHIVSAEARDGVLALESAGPDPYLFSPPINLGAAERMRVRLRLRSESAGDGQLFWATAGQPHFAEDRSTRFAIEHDGDWHEYGVPIGPADTLTRLRLDPAEAAGMVEIDYLELERVELHPLEIAWIETDGREVRVDVRHHGDEPADAQLTLHYKAGTTEARHHFIDTIEGGGRSRYTVFVIPEEQAGPVARLDIEAATDGAEPVRRRIRLHRDDLPTPETWPALAHGDLTVRLHPRALFARIYRKGERVALIGPLVMLENGDSLDMDVHVNDAADAAELVGETARVQLRFADGHLHASVESDEPVEALVTRVLGDLEQGLLPGVEYLGAGEWSSSKADIETPEHVRFAPPRMHVTMPLLAYVTDRVSVGLLYDGPADNAPVFATPNFIDGAADHRMSVRGRRIEAVYRVGGGWGEQRLEDLIEWAVRTRGLPDVPDPPRSPQRQDELSLHALDGVLRNEDGWGHCAEESWARRYFSDMASTTWRLSGRMPEVPELVRGGAHLPDDAAYLLTGRARQWLGQINGEAAALREVQRDDGSFRYDGEYARTHFEDTASGYNAQRAATLLTHTWYTGDGASLEAGLRALDYMKRFRTPRGAQTWEMPLHTPDVLGAAHLVRSYVLAYRLTGEPAYLSEARRWAVSGLPFLYQWQAGDDPAMRYAVIAVYGATNWRAPNWIGRPVQWCGLPYADALLLLAEHDQSFDWPRVAEGILVSAEWQVHPAGEPAGTLPDAYVLESGERRGPNINPVAVVSLRRHLERKPHNVVVAESQGRRIVSPYPVTIEGGTARISAEAGQRYEVVIDGQRIIEIESEGIDDLPIGRGGS